MRALKWVAVVATFSGFAIAACGGGSGDEVGGGDAGIDGTSSTDDGSAPLGDGGNSLTDVSFGDGNTGACTPKTCADQGFDCGQAGDGCGGIIPNGCGTCSAGVCGGGGPNKCGVGDAACVPFTQTQACTSKGYECGQTSDGCGGLMACGPSNGACEAGTCGGGGTPYVCGSSGADAGDGGGCTPTTCAAQGIHCGPTGDGCGNIIQCGTCVSPDSCGGGGLAGQCGHPTCTPTTCSALGYNCGFAGDGCGGLLSCGSCLSPQTCGGGGANKCGGADGGACSGLCSQQVTCDGGVKTTLSGKIFAPAANGDPIAGALVYIPNNPGGLAQFPNTITCDACGATASGSPLVTDVTGADGKYILSNVPVGANIPVVVQLGRWRRVVTLTVNGCTANALDIHLPSVQGNPNASDYSKFDNIPRLAISTGALDAIECVLRKIGIADSQVGCGNPANPSAGPRIQLYEGDGNPGFGGVPQGGASCLSGQKSPSEDLLWVSSSLNQYDMVIQACQGAPITRASPQTTNVESYANNGGRVFMTHYSYSWIVGDPAFMSTADWSSPNQPANNNYTLNASIDTTNNPKGPTFAQWLLNVGASTSLGNLNINQWRHDISGGATGGLNPLSNRWLYTNGFFSQGVTYPAFVLHYTFNTPVNNATTCGRVLFSDFHVNNARTDNWTVQYPNECDTNPMTPQEKALEFMIFDLGSCVVPYNPPPATCTPLTCAQQNITCGPAGDGCGGLIASCGTCVSPQTCGGGGVPGQCGAPTCTPFTCAQLNLFCGPAGDGCGGTLNCGTCVSPQTCGGGGVAGQCGASDSGVACTPLTCLQENIKCGPAGDGCGGTLNCGTCASPQTCGGGGVAGQCGAPSCTPLTCAGLGYNCGSTGDGCGGTLNCGTCTSPQTCGGGGTPNVCGGGIP